MTIVNSHTRQPTKLDYAEPTKFRFSLIKLPKVEYFCTAANIPGITLGNANQATPLKDIPIPGDKLDYDTLNISFLVDENLENYREIHGWMTGLGFPKDNKQFRDLARSGQDRFPTTNDDAGGLYSDATLFVLNSNFQHNFDVVFEDLIPTGLNALEFNATVDGTEYAMAQVSFRYLAYEIRTKEDTKRNKQLD